VFESKPRLYILIFSNRKADKRQTMNALFLSCLCCTFSIISISYVPLCQSISRDLKSRQTQQCVVMYCVVLCCFVLRFVTFFVVLCCVLCCIVLCCLLGFKSLLILNYYQMANLERNKYIQYLTSINTVFEILNLFSYVSHLC
jgi:hypothetical protein